MDLNHRLSAGAADAIPTEPLRHRGIEANDSLSTYACLTVRKRKLVAWLPIEFRRANFDDFPFPVQSFIKTLDKVTNRICAVGISFLPFDIIGLVTQFTG